MSLASSASSNIAHDTRPSSPLPPTHSLRILLVDDNHVNLSILSTLLKRRFSHALARPPVSLDRGLKALQLLRTQIFDLIFMDIEMPYLNGVECTRRIRAGEDGILAANRNAHIVAVTTIVGPEPASLYRHVGMDGMISKPVCFQNFQQYLCPLSIEACQAKGSVTPVLVETEEVLPPLPPIELEQRLFFVPTANGGVVTTSKSSDSDCGSPTTEYSDANQFAAMLKAQTSKSLRDRKALSIARSTTLTEPRRSSFNSPRSEHLVAISNSAQSPAVDMNKSAAGDHPYHGFTTCGQIGNKDAGGAAMLSFESLVDRETQERERDSLAERRAPVPVRPVPVHGISSPAYLLDASPIGRVRAEPAMRSNPDLASHGSRPDIHPVAPKRPRRTISGDSANDSTAVDNQTPSSSAWSSTPLSSECTTSSQRSTSLDVLSSFSSQRAASPSSAVTTPVSSPAGVDGLTDVNDEGDENDPRKAVFSPCADDLLVQPRSGMGFLDSPMLPAFPPLSKQAMSLQNSPRIFVHGVDGDDDKDRLYRRSDLLPRMDALDLDQSQ